MVNVMMSFEQRSSLIWSWAIYKLKWGS